jgi:hypothetical protein
LVRSAAKILVAILLIGTDDPFQQICHLVLLQSARFAGKLFIMLKEQLDLVSLNAGS